MKRKLAGFARGDGGVDLLGDEVEDVRGRADHAAAVLLRGEREREHLARHLEVRGDQRILRNRAATCATTASPNMWCTMHTPCSK